MPTHNFPTLLLLAVLAAPLAHGQTPAPQSAAPQPAAAPAKPPAAKPSTKPYLTVNNVAISQPIADAFLAELKARGAPDSPELQNAVREEMIRRALLMSEAKKLGLDKQPDFKRQIEVTNQLLLMRVAVADHLQKNPVTDAELQALYRLTIDQLGKTEYKLRHIQRKTEAEAKETIAKLQDGKKFDKLVKDSTDENTVDGGGHLGWKLPSTLPPGVGQALAPLKKGGFTTTPVQTDTGWHVFLVEDQRPYAPPPLASLKAQLLAAVQQQKTAQYLAGLRAQATVK
jgi:peptidyl-prolyl cis-trans isomerase C